MYNEILSFGDISTNTRHNINKLQLDYNKGGFHILRLNGKAEKNHRTIRWFSFYNKIISLQNNYPQATYLNYIIKK